MHQLINCGAEGSGRGYLVQELARGQELAYFGGCEWEGRESLRLPLI